ncbi:hypothetical protein C9426_15860 [Serratia sp. S1B]|nr:hypothetical protein C9426_15860 [Serratia sp. S1B]
MQTLNDLYYFVQIVNHGGFAPASQAGGKLFFIKALDRCTACSLGGVFCSSIYCFITSNIAPPYDTTQSLVCPVSTEWQA